VLDTRKKYHRGLKHQEKFKGYVALKQVAEGRREFGQGAKKVRAGCRKGKDRGCGAMSSAREGERGKVKQPVTDVFAVK